VFIAFLLVLYDLYMGSEPDTEDTEQTQRGMEKREFAFLCALCVFFGISV
jgi:hypothetical protein